MGLPFENQEYTSSENEASINNITGLDWANVDDNEIIRRKDATTGEGSGFKVTDTTVGFDYKKTLNFFNRVTPFNIPLGVIEYFYDALTTIYKTHISPKSSHVGTSNGMFLQASDSLNKVKVGINNSTPSKDLEVGTTLIVDDLLKYVGINTIPTMDLEILNTFYANSNTRKVGIINSAPTTTFQVGNLMYVNATTGKVGIGIADPDEELEVDGSIQINSANGVKLKFQKTGSSPHALGEVDGVKDGFNGGRLEFHTKIDGGGVTEKLRINDKGAIGINGTTFGNPTQVLTSNGYASSVSWEDAAPIITQGSTEGYLNVQFTQLTSTGRHNMRNFNSLGSSWIFNTTGTAVVAAGALSDGLIRFDTTGTYSITIGVLASSNTTSRGRYVYAKHRAGSSGSWTDFKTARLVDGQSPAVADYILQATVTSTFLYTATALDELTFDLQFDYVNTAGYVYGHWTANNMYRETFITAHKVA